MTGISRRDLLDSLAVQRAELSTSIVLTPTDSLPFSLADRHQTAFLHGLYLSDKRRTPDERKAALIQFPGRAAAERDLQQIHQAFADALGAQSGSLRLLSGLNAHTATMMSISHIGQSVVLLSEEGGGHYSTHAILARLGLRTIDLPIDESSMRVDREAALRLIADVKPDFIFIDRSEGLLFEDFAYLGALSGPIKIFDASQYLVPIMSGRFKNPLSWGFDLMLFSLHKSFPGPQKAGIVGRDDGPVWDKLTNGLSSYISSAHTESTYLAGLVLLHKDWLATYEARLFETASLLDRALASRGVSVVDRGDAKSQVEPGTHHIWVARTSLDQAYADFENLAAVGLHVNYRKLPYQLGYGLRLGTTHSSMAGLEARHMDQVAEILTATLDSGPSANLRERTADLAREARSAALLPTPAWDEVTYW